MDSIGAETNPAQPSRSSRIGVHNLNVPAGQLAIRMGKGVGGQSDDRPVQQRRRVRKGPTTSNDLATRPTTAARTRLNCSE